MQEITHPSQPLAEESGTESTPLASGSDMVSRAHCPYRQSSLLQQALAPDKMRVAFFLGAGCPMAIRVADGAGTKPLIPDVKGLTKLICDSLSSAASYKAPFETVLRRLGESGKTEPNVEEILSYIRALAEVVGSSGIEGLSTQVLTDLDKEICRVTTEVMKVRLTEDNTPYHQLATWIRGIPRTQSVEIFTCNYRVASP
jgi:hypothetical protein